MLQNTRLWLLERLWGAVRGPKSPAEIRVSEWMRTDEVVDLELMLR